MKGPTHMTQRDHCDLKAQKAGSNVPVAVNAGRKPLRTMIQKWCSNHEQKFEFEHLIRINMQANKI
jgi:hypothetical protein